MAGEKADRDISPKDMGESDTVVTASILLNAEFKNWKIHIVFIVYLFLLETQPNSKSHTRQRVF
jgi:hypothetical protein